MARLRDARPKNTSDAYERLFDNAELGALISKIHSTCSSAGSNELKTLISDEIQNTIPDLIIPDLDVFLDEKQTQDGIFLAHTHQIKKSRILEGTDFVVFKQQQDVHRQTCHIVELKDKYPSNITEALDNYQTKHTLIKHKIKACDQYQFKAHFCVFNPDGRKMIEQGSDERSFKTKITLGKVITGDQFCCLIGINYNNIVEKRRADGPDNTEFFLSQLVMMEGIMKQILALHNGTDISRGAQIAAQKFFCNIKKVWGLSYGDMAIMLGYGDGSSGKKYVKSLLDGKFMFHGHETKDRMADLLQIRRVLCSLFQNDAVERKWLNQSQEILDNKSPLNLMRGGAMKDLSLAREFVEKVAGL